MAALALALSALCLLLLSRLRDINRARGGDMEHLSAGYLEAMRRREAIHNGNGWR